MSWRQFSEPLSAVICRQFPNFSIWLRTSWTNPSPSSVAHATSQRCFLTALMSPLSVDFGMFLRSIFISSRQWQDICVFSAIYYGASASVKELIWLILCSEDDLWFTPVKGYLYFLFVRIRKVHWVWQFSGAAVLLYCQTDNMSFLFIIQISVSIAPRAFVSL